MTRCFADEDPTRYTRALQSWLVLIAKAHNRQVLTYGMLAEIVGYGSEHANVIGQFLSPIMHYCRENGLPPLTVVVVNQSIGVPGEGFSVPEDLNVNREEVFNYDLVQHLPADTGRVRGSRQEKQELIAALFS